MKKNLLMKVASALLSTGILISLIPSAVLADGDVITVDGHDFIKQSDGLYKCSLTMYEYWNNSAHPYTYLYCLLNQEIIDRDFGGTIPNIENPTQENRYFYLGEDITIDHGVKVKDQSGSVIELQGRTITYDPADTDEYLWDASESTNCSVDFQGSYFENESSSLSGGTISSPNGAPIAKYTGGASGSYGSVTVSGINIVGGYGTNYTDKRKSAFDLSGSADLYIYSGAVISSFSAEQGGAVKATDVTNVQITGTIMNCYATEGGAIYAEGRVLFGGKLTGNLADKRGGAICLIGDDAHFESFYSDDELNIPIPIITNNTCSSYEGADEGGGGIYVDSGYSKPVDLSRKITINNNNRNAGSKKNLHIICNDNSQDYITVGYYNSDEFKVGISCYGAKSGDTVIRYPSYSKTTGTEYYTSRFVYEVSGKSSLITSVFTHPDDDKRLILDFVYVEDTTKTTVLSGYSLITDGSSIGIKFYVSLSDYDRKNYNYTKYSAKVSTVGEDECYLLGNNEKTLTYRDGEFENGYYTYTYYVDSMDMTVPLKFELYKEGVEEPVDTMSGFTVRDYIDTIAKNPGKYGEKGVKAAVSIALYGAASQKYFNFRADDLADKNMTGDMKAKTELSYYQNRYKTGLFYDPEDTQYGSNMPLSIPETEHLSFYGWTMSFKGKPAMKFYFLPKEGTTIDDLYISCYLGNTSVYTKGDYIVVQCSDIKMEQMIYSESMYIYYGDEEDAEMHFYFKPINYVTRMMQKTNNTPEAMELFDAFYTFTVQFLPDYFENYYY